jgi:hypothetical protein
MPEKVFFLEIEYYSKLDFKKFVLKVNRCLVRRCYLEEIKHKLSNWVEVHFGQNWKRQKLKKFGCCIRQQSGFQLLFVV